MASTRTSSRRTLAAAWRERATAVSRQLRHGDAGWRKVKAKKNRFVVKNVAEGAEEDLRHFLTSIVLQANAGEPQRDDDGDEADARMTATFQSFDASAGDAG